MINDGTITCYDTWISIANLIILVFLPLLISVINITLTYQNVNNSCPSSSINLTSWIYVSGTLSIISSFTNVLISLIIAGMDLHIKIVMIITSTIQSLMFIWNIIGTIEFFLQMKSCTIMQDLLVSLIWSTLASQWIMIIVFIIVAVFILRKIKKKENNMRELQNLIERNEK
ncbi:MAG: hypothetical protein MUO21_10720 [Nitrososphaeraceae archaeon]|nr:hypothetical protein [Nitrososphaeraceae archaeon]